jgi:hypothetical protein
MSKDKAEKLKIEKEKLKELMKRFVTMPVDKLVPADWNYKEQDEKQQEKLSNSLKRHSQVQNIIVRELDTGFFEVVDGNHRLEEFKKVGLEEVMVYNLGKVSDAEAKLMAIGINEIKFNPDNLKLAETIVGLKENFTFEEIEQVTPFSMEDLENFEKMLNFNWEEIEGNIQPSDDDDWEEIKLKLPKDVAFQFAQQIDRFKKLLHPEEKKLKDVSYVQPIEAMCQVLAQTPDEGIMGKE